MPKTYNNLWNKFISFDNLFEAFQKVKKGKSKHPLTLKYEWNLFSNLYNLQKCLDGNAWIPRKMHKFYVYDPKKRLISAPYYEDRIVHHSLNNIIEPLFERKFIFNSYACRIGKGTTNCSYRLRHYINEYNTDELYFLKADIHHYFESINHDILFNELKRTIVDKKILEINRKIIYMSGYIERGIPIGTLTSQLYANIYLNKLDHYIKDNLKVHSYVRYMDDFVILSESKDYLKELFLKIKLYVENNLKLQLNHRTQINHIKNGIDFVGYRHFKHYVLPRKRTMKNARKMLEHCEERTFKENQEKIASFYGYSKHCNCYNSVQKMKNIYQI